MDFNSFKNAVAACAKDMGVADYELYYQAAESTQVQVFQQEVDQFTASSEGGVCLRCIVDGKMGYASTEVLDPTQAKTLLQKAVDNASFLETEEPVFLQAGGLQYEQLHQKQYDLPDTDEMVATALLAQKKLYDTDSAVVDGTGSRVICESSSIAISNSRGLDLSYSSNLALVLVEPVVEKDGEKADDFRFKLGTLAAMDLDKLTKDATEGALGKLGGDVAPTGNYPVVFSPKAMSSLLSVFSSVFSSEAAQKGLSQMAGKEGQTVAATVVNLVDDPFHPDNPMPIHFDAEGSPTFRKNIIEAGELKTLLYNLKTAAIAGKTSTGNAAKAAYDAPVGLRPFTMYLAAGTDTEAQLLEKAGNGVYIHTLEGLHAGASPVSGDFSLQSAGFMIENGKKTTPVKSFTVAGNFFQLLKNITGLSDRVELPMALGKTAFGSPCVLVQGLSIAGK